MVFRNFVYVAGSQGIGLLVGIVRSLLIPIVVGVTDYGLWQVYVFYAVYAGIFSLGYNDGLHLRYGGSDYKDLPIKKIRGANLLYLFVVILSSIAFAIAAMVLSEFEREFIFLALALNIILFGVTSNIAMVLQTTGEFGRFSIIFSIDKVIFLALLMLLFFDDYRNFRSLILFDIGSKFVVFFIYSIMYRDLFWGPIKSVADGFREFVASVSSGSHLLLANLMGMLVLGVGRIVIEYLGDLADYAFYAFAMSIAQVVLVAVTAMSIVLYPAVRRQPSQRYFEYFGRTRAVFRAFGVLVLTAFFPAWFFVTEFAPDFLPVLEFLNVVFVIIALQGKMQIVNNTYYKVLRLERSMLVANFLSLSATTVISLIGFLLTGSVLAIAYATLAVMLLRAFASELFLLRQMGGRSDSQQRYEAVGIIAFLSLTSWLPMGYAFAIWLLGLVVLSIVFGRSVLDLAQSMRVQEK